MTEAGVQRPRLFLWETLVQKSYLHKKWPRRRTLCAMPIRPNTRLTKPLGSPLRSLDLSLYSCGLQGDLVRLLAHRGAGRLV